LRVFALSVSRTKGETVGTVFKMGELPPFGPYTPPKLISLIGPDRDMFLKGRRAEAQNLGIAAFSYYRRVVESQKDRLLSEIIKTALKVGADPDVIATLERAKKEQHFSKAIDSVKPAVPSYLLIDGHNPLQMLHSALSEGLHNDSDEDCLELAYAIRVVLAELSERMALALEQKSELASAISRLNQKHASKREKVDQSTNASPEEESGEN
jgi:hypothetical protein